MCANIEPLSTTASEGMAGVRDLGPVIARLRSLLARVSAGEVVASPAFEQRLFGGLVALEVVAAGVPVGVKTLVSVGQAPDSAPLGTCPSGDRAGEARSGEALR